jgi:antagonist of KipI
MKNKNLLLPCEFISVSQNFFAFCKEFALKRIMPFLKIISPGFQTTVQDLGRYGFAHLGVSPAGAADNFALRLGNMLVGNENNEPALEMTLIGGVFEFEAKSIVAITGADCQPTIDGEAIPLWASISIRAGQTLRCQAMKNGARSYLCLRGGIQVEKIMGSAATHLQTGIGGWQGRALKKGDALPIRQSLQQENYRPLTIKKDVLEYFENKSTIRVTRGPQADYFSSASLVIFSSTTYNISEASNRVGLRLNGAALVREKHEELITEGISCGAVQVPSDGQPIILFVEHPTTGGYPKIANVISADFCRLGQLRPRDEVRFQFVSFDEAVELLRRQQRLLAQALILDMSGPTIE